MEDRYFTNKPIIDEKNYGEYVKILKAKIEDKECNNIGIIAPYGAGKSSLIETYKSIHNKDNIITISLANFNKDDDYSYKELNLKELIKDNETTLEQLTDYISFSKEKKEKTESNIEKSILQQILFSKNANKFPLSRVSRIGKNSFMKSLIMTFYYLFLVVSFVAIFLSFSKKVPEVPRMYLFNFIVIFGILLFIQIFILLRKNIKFRKFKLKEYEIEFDKKESFSLNDYYDELLYFFSATNTKILVIEDLDRFDNLDIFIKLRELNLFLNRSETIKNKVTFLYCIKDTLFNDKNERAKFFEFVLTLIPILSPKNVEEIIIEKNNQLLPLKKISSEFVHKASFFINDYRLLNNVFNDYILYWNSLIGIDKSDEELKKLNDRLNNDKLFSMMIYKNINPLDFALIQNNEGELVEIFNEKKKYIYKILSEHQTNISKLEDEINNVSNDYLANKDVLIKMINYILLENGSTTPYKNSNFVESYELVDFEDNNQIVCYKHKRTGYFYYLQLSRIKQLSLQYDMDLDKYNSILTSGKDNLVSNINSKIKKLKDDIGNLNNYSLVDLFKKYGSDINFVKVNNDLLYFLLSDGLIQEDYLDYAVLSSNNLLTNSDNKFISNVYTASLNAYHEKLNNVKNIILNIDENYFSSKSILNFQLINELYSNIELFENKVKKFEKNDISNDCLEDFFEKYLDNKDYSEQFIKYMLIEKNEIVETILLKRNQVHNVELLKRVLKSDELLLKYKKEVLVSEINVIPLMQFEDVDFSCCMNNLKKLKVKFMNIELNKDNVIITNFIVENELFEINECNLKYIYRCYNYNSLSFIFDSNVSNFLCSNINQTYGALKFIDKFENEEESTILKLLNSDISIEYKQDYLKRLYSKFNYNEYFPDELLLKGLKEGLLYTNWDNCLNIFIHKTGILKELISFVNNYFSDLKLESVDKYELIDFFILKGTITLEQLKDLSISIDLINICLNNDINDLKLAYIIDCLDVELSNIEYISMYPKSLLSYLKKYKDCFFGYIEKIKYNSLFMNDLLSDYEIEKNIIEKIIIYYKNDIMNDQSLDLMDYLDMFSFADEIILNILYTKKLTSSGYLKCLDKISNKDKIDGKKLLSKVFDETPFLNDLLDGNEVEEISLDFIGEYFTLLKVLKEYGVIQFLKKGNSKKINGIKIL